MFTFSWLYRLPLHHPYWGHCEEQKEHCFLKSHLRFCRMKNQRECLVFTFNTDKSKFIFGCNLNTVLSSTEHKRGFYRDNCEECCKINLAKQFNIQALVVKFRF